MLWRDPRLALTSLTCRSEAEDEFGISENRNVGVLRRKDKLVPAVELCCEVRQERRGVAEIAVVLAERATFQGRVAVVSASGRDHCPCKGYMHRY